MVIAHIVYLETLCNNARPIALKYYKTTRFICYEELSPVSDIARQGHTNQSCFLQTIYFKCPLGWTCLSPYYNSLSAHCLMDIDPTHITQTAPHPASHLSPYWHPSSRILSVHRESDLFLLNAWHGTRHPYNTICHLTSSLHSSCPDFLCQTTGRMYCKPSL